MVSQNEVAGFNVPQSPETANNGTGSPVSDNGAVTTPGIVSPSDTVSEPTSEELKMRIEELEAANAKQANDYKAMQGRVRSQQGDESKIDQISEGLLTMQDTLNAFLKLQGTQDEQQFREDLQKVEANASTRKQNSTFENTSELMINDIIETSGEANLDIKNSPELARFREIWGPAFETQDIAGLYLAQSEFNRAMREYHKGRHAELEKSFDQRLTTTLEEHGINSLDTDITPIPTSTNPSNLLSRMGNPDATVSREQIAEAQELMRKQGYKV